MVLAVIIKNNRQWIKRKPVILLALGNVIGHNGKTNDSCQHSEGCELVKCQIQNNQICSILAVYIVIKQTWAKSTSLIKNIWQVHISHSAPMTNSSLIIYIATTTGQNITKLLHIHIHKYVLICHCVAFAHPCMVVAWRDVFGGAGEAIAMSALGLIEMFVQLPVGRCMNITS